MTLIGAAGLRTPLIVQALAMRQARLGLDELVLMDVDERRLELIAALISAFDDEQKAAFPIVFTTDVRRALEGADFVIMTFRVGGMEARVIDERVPLSLGLLGQETTGAGGFAMAMRTIPVMVEYVELMKTYCPRAWLINFANPSGLLTEMILGHTGWKRAVGICDAPATMQSAAASLLGVAAEEVFLDYFGLNHLGWIRGVYFQGEDVLPRFLEMIGQAGGIAELPFDASLMTELGMIPNEYLYYYYYTRQAVEHILAQGETRGEWLLRQNRAFLSELERSIVQEQAEEIRKKYQEYIQRRGRSYMKNETKMREERAGISLGSLPEFSGGGYAGVALDVMEGLCGKAPKVMTLNVQNHGAVEGMDEQDVVEVPVVVSNSGFRPLAVGSVPAHCLGLMKQIKEYERLTIAAALEGSYARAVQALTLHPLVGDYHLAVKVLEGYQQRHGDLFPVLG